RVYSLGLGHVEIGWTAISNFMQVAGIPPDRIKLVKVKAPFEGLLNYSHIIRKMPMGKRLNSIVTGFVVKRNFLTIKNQVELIKKQNLS
ncbi:MAG: hypothetical protein ACM3PP_11300, partial [Candidatus Saccharibacteria bacterium]